LQLRPRGTIRYVEKKRGLARHPVNAEGELDKVAQSFPGEPVLLGEHLEVEAAQIGGDPFDKPLEHLTGIRCEHGLLEEVPEMETLSPAEFHEAGETFFPADLGKAAEQV